MQDAMQSVIDLVLQLEPGRDLDTFHVSVYTTPLVADPDHENFPTGELHTFERPVDDPTTKAGRYRSISLRDLEAEMRSGHWCDRNRHAECDQTSDRYLFNYLSHGLIEADLSDALSILTTLVNLPPENDAEQIMDGIETAEQLSSLGFDFIRFESSVIDEFNFYPVEFVNPRYNDVINAAVGDVFEEVDLLRKQTIGSEQAFDIHARCAAEQYGIMRDNSLVHVVIGPAEVQPSNEDDEKLVAYANMVRLALSGSDALYSNQFTTAPRWVVELIRRCSPSSIRSQLYPEGTVTTRVLETAITLWKDADTGVLSDFDKAIIAATKILSD
jgi:hypothetical protein